jgi:hypothetical protein
MSPLTSLVLATAAAAADPQQPHLAKAWQALSTGDGIAGEVGLESYMYLEKDEGDFQGHVWDYGESCKKFELDSHFSKEAGRAFLSGTWYYKCESVNCCFSGGPGDQYPPADIPDLKKWDISTQGKLSGVKVQFDGFKDTTELYDKVIPGAEQWSEKHRIMSVNYSYHLHREDNGDVISHRIDYVAPGTAPGSILYGNFSVQHDFDAFKQAFFALPEACQSSQVMSCGDEKVEQIERKYFKHSSWLRDLKHQQQVAV